MYYIPCYVDTLTQGVKSLLMVVSSCLSHSFCLDPSVKSLYEHLRSMNAFATEIGLRAVVRSRAFTRSKGTQMRLTLPHRTIFIHLCIRTHTRTNTNTYRNMYTYLCIYTHTYTNMHTYRNRHKYAHIQKYVYIHRYTYMQCKHMRRYHDLNHHATHRWMKCTGPAL